MTPNPINESTLTRQDFEESLEIYRLKMERGRVPGKLIKRNLRIAQEYLQCCARETPEKFQFLRGMANVREELDNEV